MSNEKSGFEVAQARKVAGNLAAPLVVVLIGKEDSLL
jgi:hypothetical protein